MLEVTFHPRFIKDALNLPLPQQRKLANLVERLRKTSRPYHPRSRADEALGGRLPGCFAGQGCGLRRA